MDGTCAPLLAARIGEVSSATTQVKTLQGETAAELDALLPAILDRAFKGEL
jgi:type I restriction enzyme S subunit